MSTGTPAVRVIRRVPLTASHVNTINLRNRVTIDFVWYPGSPLVVQSRIDTTVPNHPTTGAARRLTYTWTRQGQAAVTRTMTSGTITIDLPPGTVGTLRAFDTTWEIHRVGATVNMAPVTQMRGVQERLNRLGYHLRRPGATHPGVDGIWGRRGERAVLQFQNDYLPPVGTPAPAASRLHVRGEWTHNTNAAYTSALSTYHCASCPNPSQADGNALQAALRAVVGT